MNSVTWQDKYTVMPSKLNTKLLSLEATKSKRLAFCLKTRFYAPSKRLWGDAKLAKCQKRIRSELVMHSFHFIYIFFQKKKKMFYRLHCYIFTYFQTPILLYVYQIIIKKETDFFFCHRSELQLCQG